jgi:hypothetical protein
VVAVTADRDGTDALLPLLTGTWARLSGKDRRTLYALSQAVGPLSEGLGELAELIAHGAVKHGASDGGHGGGQAVRDHLEAAGRHLDAVIKGGVGAVDPETGKLHLSHAAVRLVLAADLARKGGR